MKYLLKAFLVCLILTFACVDKCLSQDNSVIHVGALPPDGIVLDKGWKFQVGDNPEYAASGFDDSKWESIDPTLDIHDSLPQIPEGKICWLRIHLSIDSTINDLVLQIRQSVASEIYLDGKLIHRIGVLVNGENITAANPNDRLLSFPFKKGDQILSIRFAKQPGVTYATHWGTTNPGVNIRLNSVEEAMSYYNDTNGIITRQNYFLAGVFLILGVLYLAVYVLFRDRPANLLFSIFAFLIMTAWIDFIILVQSYSVEYYPLLKNYNLIISVTAELILLIAIYDLFKLKRDWVFFSIVAFGIVCIPIGIFVYDVGWKLYGGFFTNVFNLGVSWVAYNFFRSNNKAALIIAVAGPFFMLMWAVFSMQLLPDNVGHYFFVVSQLSMPLAVSLYLAYDFALTNHSLQQKLAEVSVLSKEKQEILKNQNVVLEQQVTERTSALKKSLDDLKETQSQLVHSEKMASLGALVAGIAHEIKNPLNFVNNFAEVNKELLSELNDAIAKGNINDVKSIAKNISDNQEKIDHHGKRADGIVKSMLQHSRATAGPREPTDINALCDEYLRLTYHGYRAKDKSFTARVETHFDHSIEKIMIVGQDVGRVVLNVINNAFYAVNEKKHEKGSDFIPEVIVSTRKRDGKVEIIIKDNGTGIPLNVLDKIFQPFFTTKPPGQGTGLGLSLAYDIVKVHGGEILVYSVEGEGAEFTIRL